MSRFHVLHGDCRAIMGNMGDATVDSVVCDPPYHLTSIVKRFGAQGAAPAKFGSDGAFSRASRGFMGQEWDGGDIAFDPEMWAEVLRVLKPGGHLIAFSGSRTYHRMAVAIEDAGFEIRDQIMWLYGSGFPKSHDVSKGIDKAAGAEREVVGRASYGDGHVQNSGESMGYGGCDPAADQRLLTAPATDAARQWEGWGTALKPAHEPIVLARKPLIGTVVANVLAHGTGGLNIDGCRIGTTKSVPASPRGGQDRIYGAYGAQTGTESGHDPNVGRFPANVCHDGSDEVLAGFPMQQSGGTPARRGADGERNAYNAFAGGEAGEGVGRTAGSAARFFYCAKASKADRDEGLESFEAVAVRDMLVREAGAAGSMVTGAGNPRAPVRANIHPTVKPTQLMRYLVRLVTPPGGLVFDPFTGSGSTGKAAMLEGFRFLGAEMTAEYVPIAQARIAAACGA